MTARFPGRHPRTAIRTRFRSGYGRGERFVTPSKVFRLLRTGLLGTSAEIRVPTSIRRYKAVPRDGGDRFQMQRPRSTARDCVPSRPGLLAKQADRHDGRARPALVGPTRVHDPHGVLQAGEGRYLHPSENRPITIREAAR